MRYVMILLLATMAFGGESFSITEKWWYGFTWPEYKTYNEIRTIRQNVKHIANTMDNNDNDEGWHKSYLSEETEYYDQMREYYEDKYGTDKAIALALIKTSERYKTNILNVGRMVYMETCPAEPLTDGEIDVKTMSMVKQIGFTKKGLAGHTMAMASKWEQVDQFQPPSKNTHENQKSLRFRFRQKSSHQKNELRHFQ